jgi:hypothetical protein
MADMSLLRRLMAEGVSDGLLDEVAELLADVRALEVARAKNADRQARWKAQHKASDNVTNVSDVTNVTEPPVLDKEKGPPDPLKEINPTPGREPRARKAPVFSLPSDIPEEEWAGFEEMRRRIGKPMTDKARQLAVNELRKLADAGFPPGDVLNNSTMNSYQGLFPPKDRSNVHRPANDRPDEIQNVRLRAAAQLDAERNRGQRHAGF